MNKQKILKWALPALLMSALTFEIMPGSVSYYAADPSKIPDGVWNFFALPTEGMAASCLPIAGVATFVAIMLALVAVCGKKDDLYKLTGWCALAGAALASAPYLMRTAEEVLMPNVVVILILTGCWLLAMYLNKKKDTKQEDTAGGRRL